jgi:hypothetical protein
VPLPCDCARDLLKLHELAEALAVDLGRVSQLVAEGEQWREKDAEFRELARRVETLLNKNSNL